MKKLILTVAMGETYDGFAREFTYPAMRQYAAKVEADFVQWNQYHIQESVSYWKGLLWARDQGYDQVLYMDADVLVVNAPDIFEVDFDSIAMKQGNAGPKILDKIQQRLDSDFQPNDMFNAGVILIDKSFLKVFAEHFEEMTNKVLTTPFGDQSVLCSSLRQLGIRPTILGHQWNCPSTQVRVRSSFFIHFLGKGDQKVNLFYQYKKMIEQT